MVFEDQTISTSAAWQRACVRAIARNVSPLLMGETRNGATVTRRYAVGSVSRPGSGHQVAVITSGQQVEAFCDCEGAQNHRACQHAAAALIHAGLLAPR